MELRTIDAPPEGWDPTWSGPSGGTVHRLGVYEGSALRAAIALQPCTRLRRAHQCEANLVADDPRHADLLLGAACAFVDRWSALDRLQLTVPADHVAVGVAGAHGLVVEVRRAGRLGPGRDEWVLGRLRPGATLRPAAGPPPWPPRHPGPPVPPIVRPLALEDADAVRALSVEESVVWGTLQTPWSNLRFYVDRHQGTAPGNDLVAMTVGGVVVGLGGLHPTPHDGVVVLGMTVASAWQGRGLGGHLLDHLLGMARDRRAWRVELSVYADNTRAVALYASRGFVSEGRLFKDTLQDGGFADSLEMAIVSERRA